MSARDDLFINMGEYLTTDEASQLIDAFAHELAEQIRTSKELRDLTDDHMSDCYAAADLIDPGLSDD